MGDMVILEMTNEHPDFYRVMGPFLAKRTIAKELGGSIWDDDNKVWFVAMDNGAIAGFATLLPKGQTMLFEEAYVLPAYRDNGIHARLIDERLKHCPAGTTIQVLVKVASVSQYEARGFTVKRQRGKSWAEMTKVVSGE